MNANGFTRGKVNIWIVTSLPWYTVVQRRKVCQRHHLKRIIISQQSLVVNTYNLFVRSKCFKWSYLFRFCCNKTVSFILYNSENIREWLRTIFEFYHCLLEVKFTGFILPFSPKSFATYHKVQLFKPFTRWHFPNSLRLRKIILKVNSHTLTSNNKSNSVITG